jgi:hypothetical protein
MSGWLVDWPFCVIGLNHLMIDLQNPGYGNPTRIKGGRGLKFQETFEIEMHRVSGGDIDLVDHEGLKLKMTAKKNSLGPSRRDIAVSMCWKYSVVDGKLCQTTWWDWGGATIELLDDFSDGKGVRATATKDIIDLHCSKAPRTVWSRALDIPEGDPLRYAEAAEKLDDTPEIRNALYNLFGIRQRAMFQQGVDFREQLDNLKANVCHGKSPTDIAAG